MTIPIRPGPWSFLQTLGQGVGGAFGGLEQGRQVKRKEQVEDRAEALKQVGVIFDAVQNNQLSASTLKSDFFRQLIAKSGIGDQFAPNMVAAKPEEDIRTQQSAYVQNLFGTPEPETARLPVFGAPPGTQGSQMAARTISVPGRPQGSPEEREAVLATGRPVTRAEVAGMRESTTRANIRTGVMEQGGAAGRAAAEVLAEPVAAGAEQASTENLYNSTAGRSVDAAMTALKIPKLTAGNVGAVADAAWQTAVRDARSRGLVVDEELTRPYIDQAVQQRLREQQRLDLEASIARLRASNSGANITDDLYKLYQAQQQRIQADITARQANAPTTSEQTLAMLIQGRIANGETWEQIQRDPKVTGMAKAAYQKVQMHQQALDALNRERAALGDNFTQNMGKMLQMPDPNAVPVQADRRGQPGFPTGAPPTGGQAAPASDRQALIDLKSRQSRRYNEIYTAEQKKPASQRMTPEQITQQVLREVPR